MTVRPNHTPLTTTACRHTTSRKEGLPPLA